MATTGDHPLVLSTASRSFSVDAAVAIWPSGQKSCSLLNQLRCCFLANRAKRISLECVFLLLAALLDKHLELCQCNRQRSSTDFESFCSIMWWCFMVRHSGYDSVSQIQIHYEFSPATNMMQNKKWPVASAAPLVFFWEIAAKGVKHWHIVRTWKVDGPMKVEEVFHLKAAHIWSFFSRCFARPCRKKNNPNFPYIVGMAGWGFDESSISRMSHDLESIIWARYAIEILK